MLNFYASHPISMILKFSSLVCGTLFEVCFTVIFDRIVNVLSMPFLMYFRIETKEISEADAFLMLKIYEKNHSYLILVEF